jgi:hypothetical protein
MLYYKRSNCYLVLKKIYLFYCFFQFLLNYYYLFLHYYCYVRGYFNFILLRYFLHLYVIFFNFVIFVIFKYRNQNRLMITYLSEKAYYVCLYISKKIKNLMFCLFFFEIILFLGHVNDCIWL